MSLRKALSDLAAGRPIATADYLRIEDLCRQADADMPADGHIEDTLRGKPLSNSGTSRVCVRCGTMSRSVYCPRCGSRL